MTFQRATVPINFKRFLRTLRPVRPVQDVEDQLKSYPPAIRKVLLEKMHQNAHNDETTKSPDLGDVDYNASIVSAYIRDVESLDQLDQSFWNTSKSLARSATAKKTPKHLELFSMLFEAAKHIENAPELRLDMLYEFGRYIYRQKRVRLDPVNEVEFLDSLVAKNRVFQALHLWEMRRERQEVQGSPYWTEMGVLFYLDASLVNHANSLAMELSPPSPKVIASLIGGWCHFIRRGRDLSESRGWVEHWIQVFLQHFTVEDDKTSFNSLLAAILKARQWDLATRLVEAAGPSLETSIIVHALNQSAKTTASTEHDFLGLFEQLLISCGPEIATQPTLVCSTALSMARKSDKDTAFALLDELNEQGIPIPPIFQTELANSLIEDIDKWPANLKRGNYALLVGLKSHKWSNGLKQKLFASVKKTASDPLVIEAMSRVLIPPTEMLELATSRASSDIWTELWFLIASKRIELDGNKVLSVMLDSPPTFSAHQLVYIAQSLNVSDLIPILASHSSKTVLDRGFANIFLKTVKAKAQGRRAIIKRPQFGKAAKVDPEVSWGKIVDQIYSYDFKNI